MDTPLVSVLMTAYNREQYIGEAIESVLASTLDDFELIVVDDNSQDHTVDIARQYLHDPRVKVHINEKNLGDYPNRNKAASFARGKYLKYLDSDDIIYPHGLEIMVSTMEKFPEAGLGICRPASVAGPYPTKVEPEQAYREHFLENGLFTIGPSGCIIRAEVFQELNGFSGIRYVGDTEMWLRISAQYPVTKMTTDLVWWRVHPEQEYRLGQDSLAYFFLDYDISKIALSSALCPLSYTDRSKATRRIKYRQARRILRLAFRAGRPRIALELYRSSGLSLKELLYGLGRTNGQI